MRAPLLVTGAAGFIGARFVEACNARKIPVISVDKREYFSARKLGKIDFGLIVDRDELMPWLATNKPALAGIVHLGACTDTMELDEAYLTKMNLDYSKALWNYATAAKLAFVYASSAATYGDGSLGYEDSDELMTRLKPLNPYGESKRLFDVWALGEGRKGKQPPHWSGFKFFNVYGFGEDHKEKMASVVFHAFHQIQATGKMKLFRSHKEGIADGEQMRDFVYVGDLIQVLFFALEKPIARGVYNLGTGQARTFKDLALAVFEALGKEPNIEYIDTPLELRERYQYFTHAKLNRLRKAGYVAPFTSLEDGVRLTVARLKVRA